MLIYGEKYRASIPALQILCWSLTIVILRGNFRQALTAAGAQRLDLIAAGIAITINLSLNLALIPRYGINGAAAATLISELVWLSLAGTLYNLRVSRIELIKALWHPILASVALLVWMLLSGRLFWLLQAFFGVLIYLLVLFVSGEREIRLWLRQTRLLH
jgi:O-antigen/teichoic acid export membrane protein